MKPKNSESSPVRSEGAQIHVASGEELGRLEEAIRKAIAYRAYELFDTRGRDHGHALEDWLHAERELVKPANVQISETAAELRVRAGMPGFGPSDVQVGLAPGRLILWGQLRRESPHPNPGVVYLLGQIELPSRVDPKQARASLNEGAFELVAAKEKGRAP